MNKKLLFASILLIVFVTILLAGNFLEFVREILKETENFVPNGSSKIKEKEKLNTKSPRLVQMAEIVLAYMCKAI